MPHENPGYPHTPKIAPIQLPPARHQTFKKFDISRNDLNPELDEWQKALDDYSAEYQKTRNGSPLALDPTIQDRLAKKFRPPILDYWPAGWYVPRDGDWTKIWPSPPPPSNFYTLDWPAPGPSGVSSADRGKGRLWAYASPSSDVVFAEAQAGFGFVFTPTAQLAVYAIQPNLSVIGNKRFYVDTTIATGGIGDIIEWGGVFTAAWEISPVDGKWELVHPFGLATVYNDLNHGLGGASLPDPPAVTSWSASPTTNILLQGGGRNYVIGIVAAVQVTNTWRDPQGQPLQRLPSDSWSVWCDLTCYTPLVTVTPTIVSIP